MRTFRTVIAAAALGVIAIGAGVAAAAALGNDELAVRASASIDQMQEALRQGNEQLEKAKNEKDIIRYNCVNVKLKAIRGLVQIGELSGQALQDAQKAHDDALVRHNITKIELARARVEGFRVEIEACVGEQSQYTGGTEVDSTIDPDIRQDDPADDDILAGEPLDIDRPSAATLDF